jgi:hypothetical protein
MKCALVKTISGYSVITLGVLAIALVFAGCSNPQANDTIPDSGTQDTGFLATGAGADGVVYSVAVQSDGKVLIGGEFTTYNGTSRGRVARLNSDGSLDTGFLATGTGADGLVYSVAVQSDGKVLIGGGFTTYNGTSRGNVARLWN